MAKKKKLTNTSITTSEKSTVSNVSYSGKVHAKIVDKKGKVISDKITHNAGTNQLFKFLVYCLAGKYQSAEANRPKYIKLLTYNNGTLDKDTEFNINDFTEASNLILMNTSVTPIEKEGIWQTTLHFTVPFAFLKTKTQIDAVLLYSETAKNTKENYSAVAYFLDENDKATKPISCSDEFNNYNLIIEWELSITNN